MTRFRLLTLACSVLFVLLAACSSGDGGGSDNPTATQAVTDEPEVTATDEPATTPAAATYDSYHYTVELTVDIEDPASDQPSQIAGTIEGDFASPDSHSFQQSYKIGGISLTEQGIIIGQDAWYRDGTAGAWTATTANDPVVLNRISLTSADPGFIDDSEFTSNISALNSEPETINGVETRRYHIPKDAIDDLSALFGDDFFSDASGISEFELTVWVGEELNGLVRGHLVATAAPEIFGADSPFDVGPESVVTIEMTINVTRINDDTIEIGPPVG